MPSALRVLPSLRRARVLLVIPLVVAVLAAALPGTAGAAPPPTYRPPVDAPVSDPFRAPSSPYGPGNRGLEYDTAPGTEVRAAADGRVTFAGSVAGARHVTVLHPDGLRTTASYLATIAVVVGQEVAQGDLLGTTEGRLHFGARSGDAYLDPASLFVEGPPQVWLVPFDRPPGLGLAGERSAIRQLLGAGSGVLHLAGRVVEQGDELLRMAAHYTPLGVQPLQVVGLVVTSVEVLVAAWEESHRPCTADGVELAPPAERRAAVLVGGLGSTSEHASVDERRRGRPRLRRGGRRALQLRGRPHAALDRRTRPASPPAGTPRPTRSRTCTRAGAASPTSSSRSPGPTRAPPST